MHFQRSKSTLDYLRSVFKAFRRKLSLGAPVQYRGYFSCWEHFDVNVWTAHQEKRNIERKINKNTRDRLHIVKREPLVELQWYLPYFYFLDLSWVISKNTQDIIETFHKYFGNIEYLITVIYTLLINPPSCDHFGCHGD